MSDNLDTLRKTAEAATPGPWHWSGNAKMNKLYLATWTNGVGRCSVMDFERWGMQQAIPRFLDDDSLMMQTAKDLLVFEVARNQGLPDDTPSSDPRVYRQEVVDVRHPNAKFLAAANPDVVLALLSRLEQAEQQVARVREFSRTMLVPHGQGVVVAARVKEALDRALDGDTRRLADDALGGDNNG